MAPLYACAKCQKAMKCKLNSVNVIETANFGPAAVWRADIWECPICGHEVLAGFGPRPVAEHYEDGFDEALRLARASVPVYYC